MSESWVSSYSRILNVCWFDYTPEHRNLIFLFFLLVKLKHRRLDSQNSRYIHILNVCWSDYTPQHRTLIFLFFPPSRTKTQKSWLTELTKQRPSNSIAAQTQHFLRKKKRTCTTFDERILTKHRSGLHSLLFFFLFPRSTTHPRRTSLRTPPRRRKSD